MIDSSNSGWSINRLAKEHGLIHADAFRSLKREGARCSGDVSSRLSNLIIPCLPLSCCSRRQRLGGTGTIRIKLAKRFRCFKRGSRNRACAGPNAFHVCRMPDRPFKWVHLNSAHPTAYLPPRPRLGGGFLLQSGSTPLRKEQASSLDSQRIPSMRSDHVGAQETQP